MANKNIIESGAGESSPQNKRAHREKKTWRAAGDLKSAALGVAEDYTEKASKALDEAKEIFSNVKRYILLALSDPQYNK